MIYQIPYTSCTCRVVVTTTTTEIPSSSTSSTIEKNVYVTKTHPADSLAGM